MSRHVQCRRSPSQCALVHTTNQRVCIWTLTQHQPVCCNIQSITCFLLNSILSRYNQTYFVLQVIHTPTLHGFRQNAKTLKTSR